MYILTLAQRSLESSLDQAAAFSKNLRFILEDFSNLYP